MLGTEETVRDLLRRLNDATRVGEKKTPTIKRVAQTYDCKEGTIRRRIDEFGFQFVDGRWQRETKADRHRPENERRKAKADRYAWT